MIEWQLDHGIVKNEIDLLAAAIHIDRYVIDAIERLDYDSDEIDDLAMQVFKQICRNKHTLNNRILSDNKSPGEGITINLEEITAYNNLMEEKAISPKLRLKMLCTCCDHSFSYYSDISKSHINEAVKLIAQELASSALERMKILKQVLGKECGCDE